MRNATIGWALVVLLSFPTITVAQDAAEPSAEMKLLEDMVGTWDEVMTNKPSEWIPEAGESKAITTRVWALDGKFIRGTGSWQPADTEFLHMLGYDPADETYLSWYFDAAGSIPRIATSGTWDAETRTLKWSGTDAAGNRSVGTTRIVDEDHNDWTVITTSPDGKVLLDLTGKCTRRTE